MIVSILIPAFLMVAATVAEEEVTNPSLSLSPAPSPTAVGEWCRRACQGITLPACPPVCPPPAFNLSCPKPRCPMPPRAPPCPACSVTCPQPVCPQPVCPAAAATGPSPPPRGEEHEVVVAGAGAYRVFYKETLDWVAARDACAEQGAHLAIPNSQAEVDIMVKIIKAQKLSWAHIGFHDLTIEGKFTTVLGQPLENAGYVEWGPGQPNGGREQNCGFMWDDGRLADGACSTRGAYLCETPFVPQRPH